LNRAGVVFRPGDLVEMPGSTTEKELLNRAGRTDRQAELVSKLSMETNRRGDGLGGAYFISIKDVEVITTATFY